MASSSSSRPDWRAFARLPAAQRRTCVIGGALLPAVTVLLKTGGYARAQRWLGRVPKRGSTPVGDALATGRMVGRAVTMAANHSPVPSTCLSRSLVIWMLLRRRGIDSEIRLGVRKDGGVVAGHAWVEHQGVPLNDTDNVAERYTVFRR
jgi:hypothetical protein